MAGRFRSGTFAILRVGCRVRLATAKFRSRWDASFLIARPASPCWATLAAIRDAVRRLGYPASSVGPTVPRRYMVLDHTLTVDVHGTPDALKRNMELEISRNAERFSFVKWAMQAYHGIRLFPPGSGICIRSIWNISPRGILSKDGVCFPDTLVGYRVYPA